MSDNHNKIAWILHGTYENQGRVYKESQTLANAGYEVNIFAKWAEGLPIYSFEGKVKISRIILNDIKSSWIPYKIGLNQYIIYTIKLLLQLFRYKPDIIHCMNFYTLHVGLIMKSLTGVPYIYDSHDLFIERMDNRYLSNQKRIYLMRLEKIYSIFAARVIQTSTSRAQVFLNYYGIKPEIIMNKAIMPKQDGFILQGNNYPELNSDVFKVVYVGNVLEGRGLEQLGEATKYLDNAKVFILGKTTSDWGENVLKRYKHLNLIPSVHSSLVTDALKPFDLGISLIQNSCLSYYLECPTKVWELIAAGIPQLASDFPEIRKVIIDNPVGPIGRVVDPSNIELIKLNIRQMIDNREEINIYISNLNKLRTDYSWEIESLKLQKLYEDILKY